MAIIFPDPTLQTPVDTFSPTSTPDQTTNGLTYIYNNTIGAWVSTSPGGGGPTAATLAEAATGTLDTVYSSPKTAVPKNAAGMTGAALMPGGNNAARAAIATPVQGMMRYNNQTAPAVIEYYDGSNWVTLTSGLTEAGEWFGHGSKP